MTVLVIGGCGYIGSHICHFLMKNNIEILVLDNLSTGFKEFIPAEKLILGDAGDATLLKKIFAQYRIDAVFHFAASSIVSESNSNPQKYYENNVVKTKILLDTMISSDVNNFIFSSTAAVYGIPEVCPIPVTAALNPINAYGRSKLAIEFMLQDYSNAYNLKYISLRYFNAAGAWPNGSIGESHDPETHLIPCILQTLLNSSKDKFVLNGNDYNTPDGTCIRDYIHVMDLASAHFKAMQYLIAHSRSDSFNLGLGMGHSIKQVLKACENVTGQNISFSLGSRRQGDPDILIADPSKAFQILNWKPQYSNLTQIIQHAFNWEKLKSKNPHPVDYRNC